MINTVLDFINNEANAYLKKKLKTTDDLVTLSNIDPSQKGNATGNRVAMSLVGITRDASSRPSMGHFTGKVNTAAAVNFNLQILFSVDHPDKPGATSGNLLFELMNFFQQNYMFDPANSPNLSKGIAKIEVDLENAQPYMLAGMFLRAEMGLRPSIAYKVRVLTVPEELIKEERPVITGPDTDGEVK